MSVVNCARCGATADAAVCPTCGAAMAYAPPLASTDSPHLPHLEKPAGRFLRAAGTLQIVLCVMFAIGGVAFYARGMGVIGGVVGYPLLLFGTAFWFDASLSVRRQHRWAWLVSI